MQSIKATDFNFSQLKNTYETYIFYAHTYMPYFRYQNVFEWITLVVPEYIFLKIVQFSLLQIKIKASSHDMIML